MFRWRQLAACSQHLTTPSKHDRGQSAKKAHEPDTTIAASPVTRLLPLSLSCCRPRILTWHDLHAAQSSPPQLPPSVISSAGRKWEHNLFAFGFNSSHALEHAQDGGRASRLRNPINGKERWADCRLNTCTRCMSSALLTRVALLETRATTLWGKRKLHPLMSTRISIREIARCKCLQTVPGPGFLMEICLPYLEY